MNELRPIFEALKALLKAYEPPFTATIDTEWRYELWSKKPVGIDGRKRKEVYFGGLIIQSTYVGLYYMPMYAHEDLKAVFAPDLLKLLKGKSCFHVKALTPELTEHIRAALELGFRRYQQNGWV